MVLYFAAQIICFHHYRLSSLFSISEYLDEAMLIPKNTSVLIRRVPGRPRMPIVTELAEYYLETFKFILHLYLILYNQLIPCN